MATSARVKTDAGWHHEKIEALTQQIIKLAPPGCTVAVASELVGFQDPWSSSILQP
jgi:hypothetical protein